MSKYKPPAFGNSIAWAASQSVAINILGLLTVIVLARLLDPESFGLVAFAMVFIAFCQIFVDQGMADAIIQQPSTNASQLDTAFWISLLIGVILAAAMVLIAPWVARSLDQVALVPVIRWLAVHFVLSGMLAVPNALLRRKHDFKGLAIIDFWSTLIASALAIFLALKGWGVFALVVQSVVKGLGNLLGQFTRVGWKPGFRVSPASALPLLRFGINITGIRILSFINRRYDDFLVGIVLGPTALGFYTIAYRVLIALTNLVSGTGNKVTFPYLSRLQANTNDFQTKFYEVTHWSVMIAIPLFVMVALLSREMILLIFGVQWAESAILLAILSFHGLAVCATFVNGATMIALGKPGYKLVLMAIGTLFNIVAFSIAIHWGLAVLCLTYVFKAYLFIPLDLVFVGKVMAFDRHRYLQCFKTPVIAGISMFSVVLIVDILMDNELGLIITAMVKGVLGVVTFLGVLIMIDRDVRQRQISRLFRVMT